MGWSPLNLSWRTEWPHWFLLAIMTIVAVVSWPQLPEQIPVHWNIEGQPDRFGSKWEGVALFPSLAVGIYLLLALLPMIDPGRANYRNFATAYNVLRFSILLLMAFVHLVALANAAGFLVPVERAVPAAVGLLMVVCGLVMGKLRPNWFAGIRTPWTLSSKVSWTKTHRLGGWVFLICGALMFLAGLGGFPWVAIVGGVGGLILGTIALVIYSYFLWRSDPDRISPAGTLPDDSPSEGDQSSASSC